MPEESIVTPTSATAAVATYIRRLLRENADPRTRWTTAPRRTAFAVLLTLLAAIALCLISADSTHVQQPTGDSGIVDPVVLRLIVDRVHLGENYYAAAGLELRKHGYATGSVFNWREPIYAWLLGNLPNPSWARVLLASLAVVSIAWGIARMLLIGRYWMAIILFYPLLGANAACFLWWGPTTIEVWAGQLIFLSVLAFGSESWLLGVISALAALFFRELAAPYVIVCVAMAIVARRSRELAFWAIGLTAYAIYFAVHIRHVHQHMSPVDRPEDAGWLYFGGIQFILTRTMSNLILSPRPLWTTAVYLPLAILGLTSFKDAFVNRALLTVLAYCAFFAIIGKPENGYWGFVCSPLLAFGIALSPYALFELLRQLRRENIPAAGTQPTALAP